MEFWPGALVVHHGETTTPINMQVEVPILETWLRASPDDNAHTLADLIAEMESLHWRSTEPETAMALRPTEAQALHRVLEANRKSLNGYSGLANPVEHALDGRGLSVRPCVFAKKSSSSLPRSRFGLPSGSGVDGHNGLA